MGQSDSKLTAKVYTDEMQLPIYSSIKGLPRVLDNTQMPARISGTESHNVLHAGATNEGINTHETPDNKALCPVLSLPVAEDEMERVKGIEPSCQKWFKVVNQGLEC